MSDEDPPEQSSDDEQPGNPALETTASPSRRIRESRAKRELREHVEFWRFALATPIGRRELWRLIFSAQAGHLYESRFPAGSVGFPDGNAAWYARGEQDLARRIYDALERVDHDGIWQMRQENDYRLQDSPVSQPKKSSGE